jgi:predicted ATP-dependent endonuclease of OLD family
VFGKFVHNQNLVASILRSLYAGVRSCGKFIDRELMKIEKIKIENFRTLEDLTINFDGYFSSISGKNNAGKTSIIKAIGGLFIGQERDFPFFNEDENLSYTGSKTQWIKTESSIKFDYDLTATKAADPGLHSFIKKIAEIENLADNFKVKVIVLIMKKK